MGTNTKKEITYQAMLSDKKMRIKSMNPQSNLNKIYRRKTNKIAHNRTKTPVPATTK